MSFTLSHQMQTVAKIPMIKRTITRQRNQYDREKLMEIPYAQLPKGKSHAHFLHIFPHLQTAAVQNNQIRHFALISFFQHRNTLICFRDYLNRS